LSVSAQGNIGIEKYRQTQKNVHLERQRMKTTSKKSVGEKKKAHTQCTARNKPLKKKFRREFEEIRLSKQRPFGETWVPMIMAISLKSCSRQLTFALNEREEMVSSTLYHRYWTLPQQSQIEVVDALVKSQTLKQ
jgi:hypothetical protein